MTFENLPEKKTKLEMDLLEEIDRLRQVVKKDRLSKKKIDNECKCKVQEENDDLVRENKRQKRLMFYKDALINRMFNMIVGKSHDPLPLRSGYPELDLMSKILGEELIKIQERLISLKQDDLTAPREIEMPDIEIKRGA